MGVDISVMADTKAMAGHSDILAGHAATRDADHLEAIKTFRRLAGATVSPFDAFLLHRGLETLELRVARANANALSIATLAQCHPAIQAVHYPGLPADPFHDVAVRQMTGFGPIVSIVLGSRADAERFIDACPLLIAATSFGGVHSSAECRIKWGDDVPEGFVRIACGIEPTQDLITSVHAALDTL